MTEAQLAPGLERPSSLGMESEVRQPAQSVKKVYAAPAIEAFELGAWAVSINGVCNIGCNQGCA